jgi:hypothetical protein
LVVAQSEPNAAAGTYDSADLAFFDNVLDRLVEEIATTGGSPVMNGDRDALRRQLATRLFECAQAGERDYVALRESVLSSGLPANSGSRE